MIRKAVIPCAGLGTRMLPWSASVPKELLPVGNFPVFHYVLQEAAAAGIETIILVNAAWKTSLDNYLQLDQGLLDALEISGKSDLIEPILALKQKIELVSVRQDRSLGLGHAIGCARSVIGQEPFAVLLPDELILQTPPLLHSLIAASDEQQGALALLEVDNQDVHRYGIAVLQDGIGSRVTDLVEKPDPDEAPSRWAIVGRYVFPAGFQTALTNLNPGAGGELQLTDAMKENLAEYPLQGIGISGQRYDTGNPQSYNATLEAFLKNPEPFSRFARGEF